MKVEQALEIMKKEGITSSKQMVWRWIKQGKIRATLTSKKQGYEIDAESLQQFISQKKTAVKDRRRSDEAAFQEGYDQGYQAGFKFAKSNQDYLIKQAVKEREKSLIEKGSYEEKISFSRFEAAKDKAARPGLANYLKMLGIDTIEIIVLGSWAMQIELGILINIDLLPYPNRRLKTRLREAFTEEMSRRMTEDKLT